MRRLARMWSRSERIFIFELGGAGEQTAYAVHGQIENRKQRAGMVGK